MLWHADVEMARPEAPTDDQADRLAEALPEYSLTTHDRDRGRITLRFEIKSRTLVSAVSKALLRARAATTYAFGESHPEPCAVRVLSAEDHEREIGDVETRDLIGFTQIGKMLGVTRQRAAQLAERQDFPRPAVPARERKGPLFARPAVIRFATSWQRQGGRPRKRSA
jgi:hypothetical protein